LQKFNQLSGFGLTVFYDTQFKGINMRSIYFVIGLSAFALGCKPRSFNTTQSVSGGTQVSGLYTSKTGNKIHIAGNSIAIVSPTGQREQGVLQRDGTLGASYNVRFPEGYVCGGYQLSLWIAEGKMGDGSSFKLSWQRPDGSVAKQCQFSAGAEGAYDRQSLALAGTYSSGNGHSIVVQDGKATIMSSSGQNVVGRLERDGTAGGTYSVRFEEGFVCGSYQLSLWAGEGKLGNGDSFKLSWKRPDGSVVKSCAEQAKAEGEYKRVSMFGGVYYNDKQTKVHVSGNKVELSLAGQKPIEGQLERDGTLGASYVVRFPEGFVCGQLRFSLWKSEGVVGDGNSFDSSWIAPSGSVRQSCTDMPKGEGKFLR
jgi:hypothetical protein